MTRFYDYADWPLADGGMRSAAQMKTQTQIGITKTQIGIKISMMMRDKASEMMDTWTK